MPFRMKRAFGWVGAFATALTVLRQIKEFLDLSRFADWLVTNWQIVTDAIWGRVADLFAIKLLALTKDVLTLTAIVTSLWLRTKIARDDIEEFDIERPASWLGIAGYVGLAIYASILFNTFAAYNPQAVMAQPNWAANLVILVACGFICYAVNEYTSGDDAWALIILCGRALMVVLVILAMSLVGRVL